jgi:hypothetical protein
VVGKPCRPKLAIGPGIDMGADLLDPRKQVVHPASQVFVGMFQVFVPLGEPQTTSVVQDVIVRDGQAFRPPGL